MLEGVVERQKRDGEKSEKKKEEKGESRSDWDLSF